MTQTSRSTSPPSGDAQPAGRSKELPGLPPPVGHWATRADLLRDRAGDLSVLHRADLSLRTVGATTLLILTAALLSCMASAAAFVPPTPFARIAPSQPPEWAVNDGRYVGFAVACVLLAVALLWVVLRRTLRAREVGLRRRAWEDLADTPEARALPRGDLDPVLREPFDARTDPDGDQFTSTILVRMQVAPWEDRLLARAVPAGMGIGLGIGGVLVGLAREPGLAGFVLAGPLVLLSGGMQAVKSTQRAWRATQRWKRATKEHRQWVEQRSSGPQQPGARPAAPPG